MLNRRAAQTYHPYASNRRYNNLRKPESVSEPASILCRGFTYRRAPMQSSRDDLEWLRAEVLLLTDCSFVVRNIALYNKNPQSELSDGEDPEAGMRLAYLCGLWAKG